MSKEQIKQKIKEAIENDPNKEDIVRVSLFGSYIHSEAKGDSDVDILIEFRPNSMVGFFTLAQIKRNMEKFAQKEVDLLTPQALSKYFRDEVLQEAETIYEKK
jgi:uncharacterized protein